MPTMALVMHLFRRSIFKEASFLLGAYVYLAESLIPLGYRKTNFAVLSESSKKDVVALGVPEERIWIIPPCVNLSRYTPATEPPRGRPLIIHVGRLKRYKSVHHLLGAADILKRKNVDFEVAIVGTGDDLSRLKKMSKKLALGDSVRFLGWISEDEKIRLYRRATLAVENSVKEGWGIIVIEANACGVPAVAARSPGLVDSVVDNETGLLYEYGNVEDLADKLESLLRDRNRRERMAAKAVEWARGFSWDSAADSMLSLIQLTTKEFGDRDLVF
jgi:glycosyltransferase involved in cell wall biosynthesis